MSEGALRALAEVHYLLRNIIVNTSIIVDDEQFYNVDVSELEVIIACSGGEAFRPMFLKYPPALVVGDDLIVWIEHKENSDLDKLLECVEIIDCIHKIALNLPDVLVIAVAKITVTGKDAVKFMEEVRRTASLSELASMPGCKAEVTVSDNGRGTLRITYINKPPSQARLALQSSLASINEILGRIEAALSSIN